MLALLGALLTQAAPQPARDNPLTGAAPHRPGLS